MAVRVSFYPCCVSLLRIGWNVNESLLSSVGLEGRLRAMSMTIKTTGVMAEPTFILLMAGKGPQLSQNSQLSNPGVCRGLTPVGGCTALPMSSSTPSPHY